MQFMILQRADAATESADAKPDAALVRHRHRLADEGRLALALDLRPSSRAVRLRLGPDGASVTPGPFETGELVAGFTVVEAASKEDAVALMQAWPAGDGERTLELRETGCPGGCAQVPPAADGEGQRYAILLRSDEASERDTVPPQDKLDTLNAFNAAQAAEGRLLAGDGLKSSARGVRVHHLGGRASVIDGPFAEAKELIAGFWMIRAASMDDAIAWAGKLPYPTGPRVVVEIREVESQADTADALTPEQARADHALRAEQLDAALRAQLAAAPLAGR